MAHMMPHDHDAADWFEVEVDIEPAASDVRETPSDDLSAARQSHELHRKLFGIETEAPKIGRYEVTKKLGQGGMGVVYAAWDPKLNRTVAIKFMAPRGSTTLQTRIEREAQALARISHPNVIPIYETGRYRNNIFIVMELVEGCTLAEWARTKRRTVREILDVFIAAGTGLSDAHTKGLVHRDFKPDNVMIGYDGRVRVMDFGLARDLASDDEWELDQSPPESSRRSILERRVTASGALLGTPAYMSPEQHQHRRADKRTDQFSFCVAMWECLYGARPFAGDNRATLSRNIIMGRISTPVREDAVSAPLRPIIERGLAVHPSDRWPSIPALLDALLPTPST